MTPRTETQRIEINGRAPRWHSRRPLGKQLPDGTPEPGQPIVIVCDHGEKGLCENCQGEFLLVLADVEPMRRQLAIAAARGSRFVEHGTRRALISRDGDESPMPYHESAAGCLGALESVLGQSAAFLGPLPLHRIPAALAGRLPYIANRDEIPGFAHRLSQTMARGAKIIERPPDVVYYGPCPNCDAELWQERADDSETGVQCRCGYRNSREAHSQAIIDRGDDAWLTVGELVAAVTMAGQPVSRHQVNWWIKHDGLAREERARARWIGGELVGQTTVSVYRLGDVRARALEAEIKGQAKRQRYANS